jgi:hypothetical protein
MTTTNEAIPEEAASVTPTTASSTPIETKTKEDSVVKTATEQKTKDEEKPEEAVVVVQHTTKPAPASVPKPAAVVPVVHVDIRPPTAATVPTSVAAPPSATAPTTSVAATAAATSSTTVVPTAPAAAPKPTVAATSKLATATSQPVKAPLPQQKSPVHTATKPAVVVPLKPKQPVTSSNTNAVVPPAAKKRKTATAVPQPQQQLSPPHNHHQHSPLLLADSNVVQMVHDILGLLQTHGPLTKAQLEFNLPRSPYLSDILQVMVATGVLQVVNLGTMAGDNHVYCVLGGQTRPLDAPILPQEVLPALLAAQQECRASVQRSELLRDYVTQNQKATTGDGTTSTSSNKTSHPRQLLHGMLKDHGNDMRNDPVYVAAMRNLGAITSSSAGSSSSSRGSKK